MIRIWDRDFPQLLISVTESFYQYARREGDLLQAGKIGMFFVRNDDLLFPGIIVVGIFSFVAPVEKFYLISLSPVFHLVGDI